MKYFIIINIFLVFIAGCKDRYDLPQTAAQQSILVVEGNLNTGAGATNIRLTRTSRIERFNQVLPELNAQVRLQGDDNSVIPFAATGNGNYGNAQLVLNPARKYKLLITTASGREYRSDFIMLKNNTPIDSLGWKQDAEGVAITVNTHDPSNQTRYYRWDYTETWEIHSTYEANVKYFNQQVVPMVAPEQNYKCWKGDIATSINLGTSAALQQDVVRDQFLLRIPKGSEKLSWRYSVLVRQYALTKEAYEFYKQMKQNTESLGTIFDPQPSELKGNIHGITDPDEPVIGYITASPVQEKRIFLNYYNVTGWGFQMECEVIFVSNTPTDIRTYFPSYLPFEAVIGPNGGVQGYNASYPTCVDCTTRGGSTVKPSFW